MRAVICHRFSPPEALAIGEVPDPAPAMSGVVVKVEAAGVNYADTLMVTGRYQVRPSCPFVPGLEFAGTIAAVAPDVDEWQVGDRVMGAPHDGGCFAQYVRIAANRLFKIPADMSSELAAGFLLGYGTAGFALNYRGRLRPGETVLVTGAGGGVGVAAIGVAKRMGAFVIAAAGSEEKLAVARAHGADAGINYESDDLREKSKLLTGGRGVDLVLDLVGGSAFKAALRATAPWGRLVVVGFASGDIPRIPAEYLLLKNLSVLGAGFGGAFATDMSIARQTIDGLIELAKSDPFRAEVAGRLRLEEVPWALSRLASRGVSGKFVVTPNSTTPA